MKPVTIKEKISVLEKQADLDTKGSLYTTLVQEAETLCVSCPLTDGEKSCLRCICSKVEFSLELYWAKRIISADSPESELKKFPYYRDYHVLTGYECAALAAHSDCTNLLFTGGGPLPITAILYAQHHGLQVTVLEKDPLAYTLSTQLVETLGLQTQITVIEDDAESFSGYDQYDVICVAALAGTEIAAKKHIFSHIHKTAKEHTIVLARNSMENKEILYPRLPQEIFSLFDLIDTVNPKDSIVNSLAIFSCR